MSGTNVVLLLTVLISLLGFVSPRFLAATVLRPYRIARGADYQNLLMCGFVHGDFGHLIFNMITFFFFGPQLEREIGTARFLLLYVAGLLLSGIGTTFKHRDDPHYASLGASGAILAVLFASIVYFPWQQIFILPLPVPIPAPLFAVGYLAYTYYASRRAEAQRAPVPMLPGASPGAAAPGTEGAAPADATAPQEPQLAPPLMPRQRINHDAHLFGALTGLGFVLLENPERFQGLLQYLTGRH